MIEKIVSLVFRKHYIHELLQDFKIDLIMLHIIDYLYWNL